MIKGIKVLGLNMEAVRGDGMIYELNKDYIIKDKPICGILGYHYLLSIRDVFELYILDEYRLFECEVYGNIDTVHHTNCTNHIKLVREIFTEEIKQYIEDNLEKLIHDPSSNVRYEVAKFGYGLKTLINDEYPYVRYEVAKHGYGLDKLINDTFCPIRIQVAAHGYGLDILVNDENEDVRNEAKKRLELKEKSH